MKTGLAFLLAIALSTGAAAQDDDVLAGHSGHGEAFNEGPRQKAHLIDGCGDVSFPISCTKPLTQKFFDQGVGQLHGFWYFEAERSFRQVVALEPECAMGYWGIAMANVDNPDRAAGFIEEAVRRLSNANRHEQRWIDSLAAFYEVTPRSAARKKVTKSKKRSFRASKRDRSADLAESYLQIIEDYPADIEAVAFYVNRIWLNGRAGLRTRDHERLERMLVDLFDLSPMHPAHHYRIHLWDRRNAKRSLVSASLAGQSAPAVAHQWHMAGHIYAKLHRHEDAAWQQAASARVDHAHMMRDRVMPYRIHNFAHNNEWLVRSLNHVGRAKQALALAQNMLELPRHPDKNNAGKRSSIAGYGTRKFIETCRNYGMLDELIDLYDHGFFGGGDNDSTRLQVTADLGGAFLAMGDVERGKQLLGLVRELAKKSPDRGRGNRDRGNRDRGNRDQGNRGRGNRRSGRRSRGGGSPRQHAQKLEGLLACAEGRTDEARKLLDSAGMNGLYLSDFRLAIGDVKEARKAVDAEAARNPNRAEIMARQVRVLWADGNKAGARKVFDRLRTTAGHGDIDVPLFRSLAQIAAACGYPTDWRTPLAHPEDVGKRPPLDSLGPFRWRPGRASDFELTATDGRRISLRKNYHDRPVLVVFYLGFGCLHCVDQLQAFHPMADKFRNAGIEIVAIGTDSAEKMRESLAAMSAKDRFSFPLVSDESMTVFKQWRAFDDFENVPLHGTFLIDRKGMVRWQDISFEPFNKPEWLLQECKRLLAQGRRLR